MNYTCTAKGQYTVIAFVPGDPEGKSLQKDAAAILTDSARFPVFDFNGIPKLDISSLTELDAVFQLVRKSGRKLAICCAQTTVQAVLDAAGFLAGAVLFPTLADLDKHLRSYLSKTPAAGQSAAPAGSRPPRFAPAFDFHALLSGILFLVLVAILIQNMMLKKSFDGAAARLEQLRAGQDSLCAQLNRNAEEQILRALQ